MQIYTLCIFMVLISLFQYLVASNSNLIVSTDCGPVQGFQVQYPNNIYLWTFRGIPYAIPPVGKLRWQPPISLKDGNQCWQGLYNANQFQSICYQGSGSEDCLYINIWAKNKPNNKLLPVMFYIHGGGLTSGSGSDIDEIPWRVATTGRVIAVSFNYRLNAFGYLAMKELSENDPRGTSGNYGLLDQILALQWVQKNIAAFGGDPDRVTIYGQSSGGTAVFQLLMTPSAKGLFHRAISMSGSPNISVTLKVAEQQHVIDFVQNLPCANTTGTNLLECLYSLDANSIYNGINQPQWNGPWLFGLPVNGDTISPLAIVDGVSVPENITYSFENNLGVDVPVIFGVMAQEPDLAPVDIVEGNSEDEFKTFLSKVWNETLADAVLDLYPFHTFASAQEAYDSISADIGNNCGNIELAKSATLGFRSTLYTYIMTQPPSEPLCYLIFQDYCPQYAFHTLDLKFLNAYYESWNTTQQDLQFGELITNRFIEFAETGQVSSWKEFNANPNGYVVMDLKLEEDSWKNGKQDKCKFWKENGFYPYWWQN